MKPLIQIHPIGDTLFTNVSKVQPCPSCGVNESKNCGYLETDYWGESDCTHPDAEKLDCSGCPHLKCYSCRGGK